MADKNTKKITVTGILAAVSWVISIFSFPLLYWVPFLKIDFSDVPILLGMYIYGPLTGIGIAAIRSFLSYVTSGGEAGFPIGDIAAFVATISYTLPVYFVIQYKKNTMRQSILASVLGTISLTIVLSLLNWLVILPLYIRIMGFDVGPIQDYLVFSLIPFNILKGTLVSIAFFTTFYSLHNYLKKLRSENHVI